MNKLSILLEQIAQVIELLSTGILLWGFVKAMGYFLKTEWNIYRKTTTLSQLSSLRRQLGLYILLGLDFYIVSDIIRSMVHPDLNELLSLAVIVLLRTTIGFFLGREVAEIGQDASNA
ncbi:MAG: DUF1622 domain-containing protein [Saprospiraceae bacterium]|nr:DUF1622 domain-containing protein [Saprospiraceae bacterium]